MTIDRRPSRDKILIDQAALYALRSTCSRAHVGCIIATVDYRPLVSGYNGAPAGMPHCDHTCECRREKSRQLNIIQLDWSDPPLWVDPGHEVSCPAIEPCVISVHAEANAIAYAARYGVRVEGGQLATTVGPCLNCAMLIINAGISRVLYSTPHRDTRGVELLERGGLEVVKWGHGT